MQITNLRVVTIGTVIAVGMLGVIPSKTLAAEQADVVAAIEKTQSALDNVGSRAASVAADVQKLTADVAQLKQAIKKAEELIAAALRTAEDLDIVGPDCETFGGSRPSTRTALGMGADISMGQARLHPIDGSGVHANIVFVDDGTTLVVSGTATGLDPDESYLTLIYDNGSVPGGPDACGPTIFDPTDPGFLLGTMVIGSWTVDAEGNGSLSAINTNFGADYVRLNQFRSTSVRRMLGPPPVLGAPPPTELVACGHVADRAGE
ncbi:MAG: hypothetical protein O7D91_09555 [Planctomycetota bacterium]|nr:hypothetical protein [Planctomycetota bacterium]